MIQTVNFKTRTIMEAKKFPCKSEKFFPIGLDIGYSGVKAISPNKILCFPSYAIKIPSDAIQLREMNRNDIMYRDETGMWYVGELAQQMIGKDDVSESVNSLYGRKRYITPIFKIISRVGIAIAMLGNEYGSADGKTIVIQTGLPPSYAKTDAGLLRNALQGRHEFEIKIGNGEWRKCVYELPESNLNIMPQPLGSLVSLTFDAKGNRIPNYRDYLGSNVNILIDDAGFGTDDFYDIRNGIILNKGEGTKEEFGMKKVLEATTDEIFKRYGVEIPVHTMQKYLQTGKFNQFKPETMEQVEISFADILDEMSTKICMESIEYMKSTYNYLQYHQYLVVTGGTGAAWLQIIQNYFSKMNTLKVIGANIQDKSIPHILSNARGYYFNIMTKLQ